MLHTVTRFPGVNSHSCQLLRTNATRTLIFGAKRNGKDACRCAGYADRSCRCLPALEPTLVASMDGRPCTEQPELAGRGSGGTGDRNHRAIKAGKWGRMCHRSSWQRIDRSSEVPSAGSGPSGPPNKVHEPTHRALFSPKSWGKHEPRPADNFIKYTEPEASCLALLTATSGRFEHEAGETPVSTKPDQNPRSRLRAKPHFGDAPAPNCQWARLERTGPRRPRPTRVLAP